MQLLSQNGFLRFHGMELTELSELDALLLLPYHHHPIEMITYLWHYLC